MRAPAASLGGALLVAALALACAGEGGEAGPADLLDAGDGPGRDAGGEGDGDARGEADEGHGGDDVTVEPGALEVRAPRLDPAGGRWPVRVRALDEAGAIDQRQTGRVELRIVQDGAAGALPVWLRRGVGSVTLELPPGASVEIEGQAFAAAPVRTREVSGELAGEALRWGPDETIRVTADARVPPGATLQIEPGVVVLLGARVNLRVEGAVEARGEAERPLLLAPERPDAPWGGVQHHGAGSWSHAFFVGGGGDSEHVFGHSDSQPVLFAGPGARLELSAVVVQDGPGKALGAQRARLTLCDSLITRSDTGGELEATALTATDTWFTDLPDRDVGPLDDDNDGIYLKDALVGDEGAPVPSTLEGCVFMFGADDGIDHNGAVVELRRLWIEGFAHEGVAASTGGRVLVTDTAITGCEQGIEAGYGAPEMVAEHLLLVDNGVGARYGDSYAWEVRGTLSVRDSVFLLNTERAVRDLVLLTNAPGAPGAVVIERSMLDDMSWPEAPSNLRAAAILTDDLLLAPQSPGRGLAGEGADPGLLTGRPR